MEIWKRLALVVVLLTVLAGGVWWLLHRPLSPEAPPPTAAAREAIHLRFGHNSPTDSALHLAAVEFAKAVAGKSGGRITVTVHPFQELGNDDQMLELARRGELEILLTPTAKLSTAVPAMQYADLPFYFPSRQALYAMLDGEPGTILLEKLRPIGLIGVTFWENGFKHFTANRPIRTPEDFAGLKIRTMKSRIIMDQYQDLGATPVLIDFHATRQALADGVVDGQENPLVAIVGMGFHEVQSHLTLSSHAYLGYVLSLSEQACLRLPNQVCPLLAATARELTPFEREETQRREEGQLAAIRAAGVEVHTLTEEERARFARALEHLPRQFEGVIGPDLLSRSDELLLARQRGDGVGGNEILVGLDADLSMTGVRSSIGIKRGALMAMAEINAAGGVLGRPLSLVARDDKAMPSRGLENFRELAAMPGVVAVLGGMFSNVAQPQGEEACRLQIPFLVPWAAAASVVENGHTPNYVFRISANDRLAGPYLAARAAERFPRVALVLENSNWGRGNHQTMTAKLEELGRPPVFVGWFNRGEGEFGPMLDDLRRADARILLLVANAVEGAALVKAMVERGPLLPIVAHWGIAGGEFWELASPLPPELDLQILQTFSFVSRQSSRVDGVVALHRRLFDSTSTDEVLSPGGTAHAYDLVHLLAMAIRRAGSADREAVREALEQLERHEGLIKSYVPPFTPERHDALDAGDYSLARFNARGILVPVVP